MLDDYHLLVSIEIKNLLRRQKKKKRLNKLSKLCMNLIRMKMKRRKQKWSTCDPKRKVLFK